jgi:hypothetical protein
LTLMQHAAVNFKINFKHVPIHRRTGLMLSRGAVASLLPWPRGFFRFGEREMRENARRERKNLWWIC